MRLQLLSDLHLENDPGRTFEAAPQADLLVLAGDIGSYQAKSRLPHSHDPIQGDFGLGRFSPRAMGSRWKRVLYVPGNHEFDGRPYAATRARLRATCERLGITCLDQDEVLIDGVRFIGCTLWSDFDALASPQALALKQAGRAGGSLTGTPNRKTVRRHTREAQATASDPSSELTRQLREREKAFRAADFYLSKNTTLDDTSGAPLLARELRDIALREQDWLREALSRPHEAGPTVVVTHFAPSLLSADPRYGLAPGTAGFCNALDDLLPQADLWLHGHLHCPSDYSVGRCRVVANPLGYADKGEQKGFVERKVLEL